MDRQRGDSIEESPSIAGFVRFLIARWFFWLLPLAVAVAWLLVLANMEPSSTGTFEYRMF